MITYTSQKLYKETAYGIFYEDAPLKKEYLRGNQVPFMSKDFQRATLKRQKL